MERRQVDSGGGRGFGDRFLGIVALSFLHAPVAFLLAFASATVLMTPSWLVSMPEPGLLIFAIVWLIASHAFFLTFVCAWIGLPGVGAPERLETAFHAGLRALPPAALIVTAGGLLLVFVHGLVAVAFWAVAVFTAAPARLLDHGWSGLAAFSAPLPVPPLQRALMIAPSFAFLAPMTLLLRNASFGIMDGGMIGVPLLAFTAFWAFYSAALLSAAFAWEEVLAG